MHDRFSRPERRIAIALLVAAALGVVWHTVEELRPPPPPVRLTRGAIAADSTASFDLNAPPEGIVYSPGEQELIGPIDIGVADEATLVLLPGIGPVLARRIVAWREARSAPWQVDDLLEVSGIGPAKLALLKPLVRAGPVVPDSTGTGIPEPGSSTGRDGPGTGGKWR